MSLCLTSHHAMKAYWGSRSIAPRILELGIRWRGVVSFTPRQLYPQENSPWYALDRRLGGTQGLSGCGGEEKNSQSPIGTRTPPPSIQPVAQCYTSELSQLLIIKPRDKYKFRESAMFLLYNVKGKVVPVLN
jgi:hypothetical protein